MDGLRDVQRDTIVVVSLAFGPVATTDGKGGGGRARRRRTTGVGQPGNPQQNNDLCRSNVSKIGLHAFSFTWMAAQARGVISFEKFTTKS